MLDDGRSDERSDDIPGDNISNSATMSFFRVLFNITQCSNICCPFVGQEMSSCHTCVVTVGKTRGKEW